MKIIRLSASNVLRLKAVEVEPQGTVQIVAGKNGAGKSSLLNSLYLALAGGAASREIAKPVRAGEEWAEVKLDLGTILVTRTWDEHGKTTLTVKAPDGATYKSPQTLLDSLLGALTFDPLEFTRQKPADQRRTLLDLLGLDFTAADTESKRLYDLRLDTGRKAHAFGDLPKLPKGAPLTEVSASEIVDRINTATRQQRAIDELRAANKRAVSQIEDIDREIARLGEVREQLVQTMGANDDELGALPEPEDIAALQEKLAGIEDRNKVARENRRIVESREQQKRLQDEYTALSRKIDGIEQTKAAAIAAAVMPVPGLGFDADGVTFGGVPFSQASSAEQIRVSLAMAIAMNPTLRVIRIMDGSLLDSDSMAEIRAAAEEHDIQIWIEVVGENPDDPTAIVISDGEVVDR
jgi:hypothetical protein